MDGVKDVGISLMIGMGLVSVAATGIFVATLGMCVLALLGAD